MTPFGFLNCDKPRGMTSRDVVNIVQRRIRPLKVGHCGTLDPLAQGVLVLGVGPAVRLTSYVQDSEKRYIGSFRLAASSDTGDLEQGFVQHDHLPVPTHGQLAQAAERFVGTIKQIPPAYSAIWVDGKRAYRRARQGEQLEMPSRMVSIQRLQILSYQYPEVTLEITCGSGTYIRSLGIDLAESVGSTAVMTELNRVAIGAFTIENSVTIDQLRDEPLEPLIVPATFSISHLQRVIVDQAESIRLGNGLPLTDATAEQLENCGVEVSAVTQRGELRAILTRKTRGWCPVKVFPVASVG